MTLPPPDLSNGTLIQIGAGAAPGLQERLSGAGGPARAVLVEPHPDLARALAARLRDLPRVGVEPVAVGPRDGPSEGLLHVFSDLSHSSLRPPLPLLRALLPGLRPEGVKPVAMLSASRLFDGLGELPAPLHLEIDAPGSERDILAGLGNSGWLERIDMIDLRMAAEPLYEGAATFAEMESWLRAEGFQILLVDQADPDWPELRAVPDLAKRELERELAGLRERTAMQARSIADLEAARAMLGAAALQQETLAQERAVLIAGLEAELAALRQELADRTAEKDWRIGEIEAELAVARQAQGTAAARIAELEQVLEATQSRASAQEAQANERAARVSALEGELGGLRQELAARIGEKDWRIGELEADLVRARQAAETDGHRISQLEGAMAASEARVIELDALASDRAGRIAALETDLGASRAGAEEVALGAAALEAALRDARKTAEADAARMASLETAAEEARSAAMAGASAQNARQAELEKSLAAARSDLEAKTKALGEAESAAGVRETELAEARQAAATAKSAAEATARDQSSLAESQAARVVALEKSLAASRKELEDKSRALAETAKRAALVEGLEAELAQVKSAAAAAQASAGVQAQELMSELAGRDARLAAAEKALAATRQDLDATARALAEAEKQAVQAADQEAALTAARSAATEAQAGRAIAEAEAREQGGLADARQARLAEIEKALATAREELDAKTAALGAADQGGARIAELEAALSKAEAGAAEKEAATKLAAERKARAETLERRIGELEHKLSIARRELNRAEGQIGLITDLVLRGSGL